LEDTPDYIYKIATKEQWDEALKQEVFKGAGKALKWEVSRGGDLFPHLYANLKTNDAIAVFDLAEDDTGGHIFPEEL